MSEQWNAGPVVVVPVVVALAVAVVTGIVVVLALVGATAGQKRFHLKNLKTKEMQLGAMVMYGAGGEGVWAVGNRLSYCGRIVCGTCVKHTHTHRTHKEHIHETTTMSGLTALGERPLPEPTARPQLDTPFAPFARLPSPVSSRAVPVKSKVEWSGKRMPAAHFLVVVSFWHFSYTFMR